MPETMFWGTGRRKTSTARVRIAQGAGKILVNSRPFEEYFPIPLTRKIIMQPLTTTENVGKFDVYANIGRWILRPGRRLQARYRKSPGEVQRGVPLVAAQSRITYPRPTDAGTQEIRSQESPQTATVLQTLTRLVGSFVFVVVIPSEFGEFG